MRSIGLFFYLIILILRTLHDGLVEKINLPLINGGQTVFRCFVVLNALEDFDDDMVEEEFNQLPVCDHLVPHLVREQHAISKYGLEKLSLLDAQVLVPLREVLITQFYHRVLEIFHLVVFFEAVLDGALSFF